MGRWWKHNCVCVNSCREGGGSLASCEDALTMSVDAEGVLEESPCRYATHISRDWRRARLWWQKTVQSRPTSARSISKERRPRTNDILESAACRLFRNIESSSSL